METERRGGVDWQVDAEMRLLDGEEESSPFINRNGSGSTRFRGTRIPPPPPPPSPSSRTLLDNFLVT